MLPNPAQSVRLRATMRAMNAASTHAARTGFDAKVFSQPSLHARCYRELRDRFGLSAQQAVRAIGKAVEALHRDRSKCPAFRPDGAVTFDQRILSFKGVDAVSILTLEGRERIPIIYGEYQKRRFDRIKGQSDVVLRDGNFYLLTTVDLPEDAPIEPADFIGVDLGIANIAADSDGTKYSGSAIKSVRHRHRRLRSRLQSKCTRSAKRRLRRLSGKEARFARNVNHVISKQIVACAKDTGRGIALEDLKHIRSRVTVRRKQRASLHSWSFAQLRSFIEYKAKLHGVRVAIVDPRNSSRQCSICGHTEKANRSDQSTFRCRACGYVAHADINAAANLRERGRAAVNQPYATSCAASQHDVSCKPPALAGGR